MDRKLWVREIACAVAVGPVLGVAVGVELAHRRVNGLGTYLLAVE